MFRLDYAKPEAGGLRVGQLALTWIVHVAAVLFSAKFLGARLDELMYARPSDEFMQSLYMAGGLCTSTILYSLLHICRKRARQGRTSIRFGALLTISATLGSTAFLFGLGIALLLPLLLG